MNLAIGLPKLGKNLRRDSVMSPPPPPTISWDALIKKIATSTPTGDDTFEAMTNNPERNPAEWVALGDSFAAGPGAGDAWGNQPQCVRGSNAYPLAMQADNIPGPAIGQKPAFTMKACTGDVTTDLVNQNDPNYQLGAFHGSTTFVTLSIGGNDVQFSTILKTCVFGLLGNCDDSIGDARTTLYSGVMHTNYVNVINQILTRTAWQQRPAANKRTVIYQTGYSQFFDAYTDQCDGTSFVPYDGLDLGPKITKTSVEG